MLSIPALSAQLREPQSAEGHAGWPPLMHKTGSGRAAMLPSGCRQWLSPHPPPLWGRLGGVAPASPRPASLPPIASVFISVVIWGHFPREPSAAEIKETATQRMQLDGRDVMGAPFLFAYRGFSNSPPPNPTSEGDLPWQSCPCVHLEGDQDGPRVLYNRPQGRWGFGERTRGPIQAEPPPLSRASGDTAQPFSPARACPM